MEKRKLSGKTILKLTVALIALSYLGFCLYAGITGKFPAMHKVEHIMRFSGLKNWVSGGMSATMIAALCIASALNDLNIRKGKKKSDLLFFIIPILVIIFLLLLESYLDIGLIGIALYAGIAAFLFGIANIPVMLNQWVSRQLLSDKPMSGKQKLSVIEWIHFYPLKKLLVFGLWSFGIVIILRGIWVTITGKIELDGEYLLFFFVTGVLVAVFFKKVKRYICTPYHSIPVLGQILEKNQLQMLMDGECFEQIGFEDTFMKQNLDVYRSENWMLIGGKLFSKKLAFGVTMDRGQHDTLLKVLYLDGTTAKVKVGLYIDDSRYRDLTSVLKELIGYEEPLKLHGKEKELAQKFVSFFPEQNSDQERITAFLSRDVTEIRQDYIRTFSLPDNRKKKQSARGRKNF